METDFNFLVQLLKPFHPEYIQIDEGNAIIKAVKFIDKTQVALEPDILYIDRGLVQTGRLPMCNVLNIVCMGNIPVKTHHLENTRLNAIVFEKNTDIYSVFNQIQTALLKKQNLDFWSTKFFSLLTSDYSLQDIIDLGYEMLGNPVCVTDISGKCIGMTKGLKISDDTVWSELSTTGYISYNTFTYDSNNNLHTVLDSSKAPIIWDSSSHESRRRRIYGKIEIGNSRIGTLSVVEHNKPFSQDDLCLVSLLCDIVTVELQKNNLINHSRRSMYADILEALISGKVMRNEIEIIEDRRRILKLSSNATLCLITVDVSKAINGSVLSLSSIRRIIESVLKNSKAVIYNGLVSLLLSSEKSNYCFKNELKTLKEFFEGKQMYAGVSRCFYLLEDMHEYYLQSINALELGRLINNEKSIYLYEDFAIYHIAEVCSKKGTLYEYCHPSLLHIIEYDKQNNTDFTQTLYAYIDCSKSITSTSSVLNIHPNTLRYRIKKIQEIMNVDLDNNNTLLHLQLSFKMIEYDKSNADVAFPVSSYSTNAYRFIDPYHKYL